MKFLAGRNLIGRKRTSKRTSLIMSSLTILPWVLISVLTSVLAMVYAVSHGSSSLSFCAALAFSLFMIIAGFVTNRGYWTVQSTLHEGAQAQRQAARVAGVNARLMGTTYVWGAIALMAIYSLTQLRWQHGWQYALGMACLGVVSFVFAVLLEKKDARQLPALLNVAKLLTIIQAAGATLGLVYLIGSGKMASLRPDWAANHIFLFGGLAIAFLSDFSLRSNRHLMRPPGR